MITRKQQRRILVSISAMFMMFVAISCFVGGILLAPANRRVGPAPNDFPVISTTIDSDSGSKIATWFAAVDDSHATIVLVHGIRGNRAELLPRARMFRNAGFSVVLIDLQAHGESPVSRITLGHLERLDVRAAVAFAKEKNPNHRIGVVGISLGGASTLLASPLHVDAIVLESVFPTIAEAIHDRVSSRVGFLSYVISPALIWQLQPRLGIGPADLRPIDKVAQVESPVLIASGDLDQHTTVAETRRLFETAIQPKQLVIFEGVAHDDLLEHDPQKYENEVLVFLESHLKPRETNAIDETQ